MFASQVQKQWHIVLTAAASTTVRSPYEQFSRYVDGNYRYTNIVYALAILVCRYHPYFSIVIHDLGLVYCFFLAVAVTYPRRAAHHAVNSDSNS
jgi:hypothetical protein